MPDKLGKNIYTQSYYLIVIALTWQQGYHEGASILHEMHAACLVPSYKESNNVCQIYAAAVYSRSLTCNLFWSLGVLLRNGLEADILEIIILS